MKSLVIFRLVLTLMLLGATAARAEEPVPFTVPEENSVHIKVPHRFSMEEAHARIGYLLEYWGKRFGMKSIWRGQTVFVTGHAVGFDIQARFEVLANAVTAHAADPGFLMRGTAHNYVEKKLKKYMHPDYDEP